MNLVRITLYAAFPEGETPHLEDLTNDQFAEQLRREGALTVCCEWDEAPAPDLADDTDIDVLVDKLTSRRWD